MGSVGQLVKLCHGNNYNVCSPLVAVTGGTVLISCLGGERLDGNVCVKDLGIGTITKGTCTIPAGKSSCLADVTFTTSYAISGRTKIATNDPSVGNELVIQYDGPYVAGESKKVSVPAYIQEQQLFLYINDAKAAQNTTKGTCEVGSTWYISTCQRNSIPKVPKGTDMSISPYSPAYVTATSSIFLSWGPIIYSEFPNISSYGTLSYIIRVDGVERNKGSTQSFAGTPASLGLARGAHVIDAKTCNETGCTAWSGAVTVYVDVSN